MRKFLGQHFLRNRPAIKKIVAALDLKPGDIVIEIGAGHGELTDEIFNFQFSIFNKIKLIAIEKDAELADILKNKFSADKNIEIAQGDALKFLPEIISVRKLKGGEWKLIGNIPFYITGFLLRLIGGLKNKPELCVFTVQKEVAERMVAEPPQMNRLAASVRFWAKPEILGHIPRRDFSPQPEVDSAIVRLKIKNQKSKFGGGKSKIDAEEYYKAVKILFQQPRKTILNNLATSDPEPLRYGASKRQATKVKISEKLLTIGIDPNDRPQNLNVADIERVADLILDL